MVQVPEETRVLRIELELRERGISHAELSRRTGIHTSTISRLIAGKLHPYPGWKRRIGDALVCSGDDLFREVTAGEGSLASIVSPMEGRNA